MLLLLSAVTATDFNALLTRLTGRAGGFLLIMIVLLYLGDGVRHPLTSQRLLSGIPVDAS